MSSALIGFMAHGQNPEWAVVRRGAKKDGSENDLVEVLAIDPPVSRILLAERVLQQLLSVAEQRCCRVQRDHLSGAVSEHE